MANVRRVKDFDELFKVVSERVKAVVDRLEKLKGKTVSVVIDPSAKYENGEKVSQVARWIEYGTSRMAPRPFMRDAIAENSRRWKRTLRDKAVAVARGKGGNYKQALRSVANEIKKDVQKSITEYGAVRTGKLRSSVLAEVKG